MQDCFRAHPEEYGPELEDDEAEVEEELRAREELKARESTEPKDLDKESEKPKSESQPSAQSKTPTLAPSRPNTMNPVPEPTTSSSDRESKIPIGESGHVVTKAAFDATDKN